MSSPAEWWRSRVPIRAEQLRELTNEPVPNHLKRWWFALGGTPAYLFVVQIVTGLVLAVYLEWVWFYLWHHEGRRARHGASMMAPDYAHWHGMYEVAERFYMELIPLAREHIAEGRAHGKASAAAAVEKVVDEILARPEHAWFLQGAEEQTAEIRRAMRDRYGQSPGP